MRKPIALKLPSVIAGVEFKRNPKIAVNRLIENSNGEIAEVKTFAAQASGVVGWCNLNITSRVNSKLTIAMKMRKISSTNFMTLRMFG